MGLFGRLTGADALRSVCQEVLSNCSGRPGGDEFVAVITQGQIGSSRLPDATAYIVRAVQSHRHQVLSVQIPDWSYTAYLSIKTASPLSSQVASSPGSLRVPLPIDTSEVPRIEGVYVMAGDMQDTSRDLTCLRFDPDHTMHFGAISRRDRDALMEFGLPSLDPAQGAYESDGAIARGAVQLDSKSIEFQIRPISDRRIAVTMEQDGTSSDAEYMFLIDGNAGQNVATPIVDTTPIPGLAGRPSLPDELLRLAELRDQGILTDDEFSAAKAKLLSQS